jgi:hypothetical protein
MKNRNPLCAAAILSMALSFPVFGGDIQTPTIATPPPPPPITTNGAAASSLPGDPNSLDYQSTELSSEDLIINAILDMLLSF